MALRLVRRRLQVACSITLLATVALTGCSDEDPGFAPGGDRPPSSSDTLGLCPSGGPDATTPPAGCLDEGGRVQRP